MGMLKGVYFVFKCVVLFLRKKKKIHNLLNGSDIPVSLPKFYGSSFFLVI